MDSFIARHLEGVSRTYAIVVPLLPAGLADTVGLAYLLMRIVDTLEDAPELTPEQRRSLLAALDAALSGDARAVDALTRPLGELPAERALMEETPEVLRRVRSLPTAQREPISVCARTMQRGVLSLLDRAEQRGQPYPAVQDMKELREYCYYVAGTVGEMLCALMADHLKWPGLLELRPLAVELGTGLQLVNILKDAAPDARHGRRYLPIVACEPGARAATYAAALAAARDCLLRGVEYVLALPATATGLRSFCGLPIAWGALTLARATHEGAAAKIGRDDVQQTVRQFAELAGRDEDLRAWLTGMLATCGAAG